MDTMLPEYLATAIVFIVVAFKVWRRSYSTAIMSISVSFALCFMKYESTESGMYILIITSLLMMIRAILQDKDDSWIRGKTHA